MKRYAVCITDDDGGTGEAVFTVKNKTEARALPRRKGNTWERHQTWSRHGGPLMLLAVPCTG